MPAASAPLSDDILELLGRYKEAARAVADELKGLQSRRRAAEKAGGDVGPEHVAREAQLAERRDHLLARHERQQDEARASESDNNLALRAVKLIPGGTLVAGEALRLVKEYGGYAGRYGEGNLLAARDLRSSMERVRIRNATHTRMEWTVKEWLDARRGIRAADVMPPHVARYVPTTLQGMAGMAATRFAVGRAFDAFAAGNVAKGSFWAARGKDVGIMIGKSERFMGEIGAAGGRIGAWAGEQTLGSMARIAWPGAVAYAGFKWAQEVVDRQGAMAEQQGAMFGQLNQFENEQRWKTVYSGVEARVIRDQVIESSARAARPQGVWESAWQVLTQGEGADALARRTKAEKISMQMLMLQKTTGYQPMSRAEAMQLPEVQQQYEGWSSLTWGGVLSPFSPTGKVLAFLGARTTSKMGWLGWAWYKARDVATSRFKDRELEQLADEHRLKVLQSTVQSLEDRAKTVTENPSYRAIAIAWANNLNAVEQWRFQRFQQWNQF